MNEWIPVKNGKLPENDELVHVTYLSYLDNIPMCDALAYYSNGEWNWVEGETVTVPIIAWKPVGTPYCPNEDRIKTIIDMLNVNKEDAQKIVIHLVSLNKTDWIDDVKHHESLTDVHYEKDFDSMLDWLMEDMKPHEIIKMPNSISEYPTMLQLSDRVIFWYF